MADQTRTFTSGLWHGVRDTSEPFDDTPDTLQDAVNVYLPDPQSGSGAFGRPAFQEFSGANPPGAVVAPFGQTINGTFYTGGQAVFPIGNSTDSLMIVGGVAYTVTYPTAVDYMPGVSSRVCITPGVSPLNHRFGAPYGICVTQLDHYLIVNDGVFTPWVYDTQTQLASVINAFPAVNNLSTDVINNTRVAVAAHQVQLLDATGMPSLLTAAAGTVTLPAGTVPKNTWAAWRVKYTVAGGYAMTAAPANYTTGYVSEAAAIAALDAAYPAVDNSTTVWNEGYFTLLADVTHDFVCGTTPLITSGPYPPGHVQTLNYYAGRAAPWQAIGNPCVYTGAVFFIDSDGLTLLWSEPNDPFTGYQQSNYDNAWTLAQTSNAPLYALSATNVALYYYREYTIGSLQGAPGVDFQNTATHDSVSFNIGCTSPASICQFGQYTYFADAAGRPHRFTAGTAPDKIWLQARNVFQDRFNDIPVPVAFLDPNLNAYVVLPFTQTPSVGLAFDALTGRYMGRWVIAGTVNPSVTGMKVDACGVVNASITSSVKGRQMAMVLGTGHDGTTYGYGWVLQSVRLSATYNGYPAYSDAYLDPDTLTQVAVGQENSVQTNRLGYSTVINYDLGQVRTILDTDQSTTPANGPTTTISVTTPNGVYAGWTPVTPPQSYDGVNLATFLASGQITGRGMRVLASNAQTIPLVSPWPNQWVCYRVEADVVPSRAYPGER
jgi:hypothetical protein